jgi:hypothetical protein
MALFDFADGGAGSSAKALKKGARAAGNFEREGINRATDYNKQGVNEMLDYINQARMRYEPYAKSGKMSFDDWMGSVKKMQNPTQFYNDIMSQYQMSAPAQYRLKMGLDTVENQYAAAGRLGGGAIKRGITQLTQDTIGQDQQEYLNDILGINNNYLAGAQSGAQMGYDATSSMAGLDREYGNGRREYNGLEADRWSGIYGSQAEEARAIAAIKAQKAQQQAAATNQWIGQGIQMGADYATGGATAMIRPFTSAYKAESSRPVYNNYGYGRGGY